MIEKLDESNALLYAAKHYDNPNCYDTIEFYEKQKTEELEKIWSCYECEQGVMKLVILNRAGEPYYIRKCNHCDNKTKMKKYTEEITGV